MLDPNPLIRQLISILAAHREKSCAAQRKRGWALKDAVRRITAEFGLQKLDNLGLKHVRFVIESWKAEDRGRRAIEEKLTYLRWLVAKIGKQNLIPRRNRDLGIEPGPRFTRAGHVVSEAKVLSVLARLKDPRLRAMIGLARELGLRFEEAALFRPHRDWESDKVWVKRGTKGGRPRYLWIHSREQVAALEAARALTSGDGALIPKEAPTFDKWRQSVYRVFRAAGLSKAQDATFHDLRRNMAARRMEGLIRRGVDRFAAAKLVSKELGHNRVEILQWYVDFEALEGGDA